MTWITIAEDRWMKQTYSSTHKGLDNCSGIGLPGFIPTNTTLQEPFVSFCVDCSVGSFLGGDTKLSFHYERHIHAALRNMALSIATRRQVPSSPSTLVTRYRNEYHMMWIE